MPSFRTWRVVMGGWPVSSVFPRRLFVLCSKLLSSTILASSVRASSFHGVWVLLVTEKPLVVKQENSVPLRLSFFVLRFQKYFPGLNSQAYLEFMFRNLAFHIGGLTLYVLTNTDLSLRQRQRSGG